MYIILIMWSLQQIKILCNDFKMWKKSILRCEDYDY